jgi:hypothetical protein
VLDGLRSEVPALAEPVMPTIADMMIIAVTATTGTGEGIPIGEPPAMRALAAVC